MSELRWHPLLGEWVISATHRQDRTFLPPAGFCPLCPQQEGGAPTEIPRPDYQVVAFENRFPSLRPQPPEPESLGASAWPVAPAGGACEVLCYTQRHEGSLAGLSLQEAVRLVRVWKLRFEDLAARPEVRYVYPFENKGEAIGVTLHHPHGQLYAFPYLPPLVERMLAQEAKHHQATGVGLHAAILAAEEADGRRLLLRNEDWAAYVPSFARYPYEVHVVPRGECPDLGALAGRALVGFAQALLAIARGYDALWGFSMPYIMQLHQRPTDGGAYPGAALRAVFTPPLRTPTKLKYLAGCEAGCGSFINDARPEDTARALRVALQAAHASGGWA